jgi:hypothetical protein
MNWDSVISLVVLAGAGFLALRSANFNINYRYLAICLGCLLLLWGFFTSIGYY